VVAVSDSTDHDATAGAIAPDRYHRPTRHTGADLPV
jgi:hypothetical protein